MSRSRPASASSTLSTGIAAIVVQFGFAMMPLRTSSSACGFTSLTMSGTSGSMRQALELSMTSTPAAAKRGAWTFDIAPPAEKIATSRPRRVGRLGILDDDVLAAERKRRAGAARRREEADLAIGKSRSTRRRRTTAPT